MTLYQVGTVSKGLQEIGWRTNVFLRITAVLSIQVGLVAHTHQPLKVWSLVESVILTTGSLTCTGKAAAVAGVTIWESGTAELSSCMSYKSLLTAIFFIVVTAAQVSCFVCFFECLSQQTVIKQPLSSIIKQSLKAFFRRIQDHLNFSNLRWLRIIPDDNKAVPHQTDHMQLCMVLHNNWS